jgi:adenylate cyclase
VPAADGRDLPSSPEELEQSLLGGPRRWRRREVAHNAGVSLLSARKLWRALGFASVDDDDLAFTDDDVLALERTVAMVRDDLIDEATAIAFARALGQNTDRMVSWQVEALMEHQVRCEHPECVGGGGDAAVAHLAPIVDELEQLLVYTWRRKLAAAVVRIGPDHDRGGDAGGSGELTVGFADLVSYTQLSQRLSQSDLGVLVQRFEALAADQVTAGGGRVIKTVGDEMLFTARDPVSAAVIGLSLSEKMATDAVVPDVRVGIAHGPVLHSLGDVYGPTVNLASRLTALAEPGTVVTDAETAKLLAEHEALTLVPQRRRKVRGFGTLQPLLVTRAGVGELLIDLD